MAEWFKISLVGNIHPFPSNFVEFGEVRATCEDQTHYWIVIFIDICN